jgi:hypothetical protein
MTIDDVIRILLCYLLLLSSNILVFSREEARELHYEMVGMDSIRIHSAKWDVSKISVLDERSTTRIEQLCDAITAESIEGRVYSYAQSGDTLLFKGWNIGRDMSVLSDIHVPCQIFGGSTTTNSYEGIGCYYDQTFHVRGSLSGTYIGSGHFIIDIGDTIRDVRLYCQKHNIIIGLKSEIETPISETTTTYRWYRGNDRIPFAIQQECGTDRRLYIYRDIRDDSDKDESLGISIQDALHQTIIHQSPNNLEIVFPEGLAATTVDVYIMDSLGNTYGHQQCATYSDANAHMVISTENLLQGRYIVSIIINNDTTITEKRLIVI